MGVSGPDSGFSNTSSGQLQYTTPGEGTDELSAGFAIAAWKQSEQSKGIPSGSSAASQAQTALGDPSSLQAAEDQGKAQGTLRDGEANAINKYSKDKQNDQAVNEALNTPIAAPGSGPVQQGSLQY